MEDTNSLTFQVLATEMVEPPVTVRAVNNGFAAELDTIDDALCATKVTAGVTEAWKMVEVVVVVAVSTKGMTLHTEHLAELKTLFLLLLSTFPLPATVLVEVGQ